MNELETIEHALTLLKTLKSDLKKRDKLSEKARDMTPQNSTPNRIQAANANLNWACMHFNNSKIDFARFFEKSKLNVSTGETTNAPSGWHSYKK